MITKEEYFKQWSEKLSISISDIEKEFNIVYKEIESEMSDISNEDKNQAALTRLAISYKKMLRSPAVGFEGIIIGAEETRDFIAKQRKEAIDFFKENPQLAISQGAVNEDGIPLDNRETWNNGNVNNGYGKPLPANSFMRKVYGVAGKTIGDNKKQFFTLTINGEKCNQDIPLMKSLRFMAIDKSEEDSKNYLLNASAFTEFKIDESIELPEIKELVKEYMDTVQFSDLESYHKENKDDFNRIVAIEGDVSLLNLEPTSVGSRIMTIEDGEDMMNLDSKGLTCWVPGNIEIDFSEGSKVCVIGRTSQGKLKDDQGNLTEEDGDVSMNVFSIIPLTKISIPKVDLIEEI